MSESQKLEGGPIISSTLVRLHLQHTDSSDRYTTNRLLPGGSASSINSLAGASRTTLMSISTKSWDSSDCLCFRKTFRGRRHDVLSESRMR